MIPQIPGKPVGLYANYTCSLFISASACQRDPYFIPPANVSSSSSSSTCRQYGGELVNVTNSNFNDVTTLLFDCRGAQSRAWINSWDGYNYGSNCLSLYTGSGSPGGAINTNCANGDIIPPVCFRSANIVPVSAVSSTSLSISVTPITTLDFTLPFLGNDTIIIRPSSLA
ncbi:uncharacterized protein B0P05DRAFT_530223 [Gilbertella persicaria]|uniref:uncharacterized protein n=1 Tax=Gilbertella persicaria TaxID=101096 RepID=UPI0022202C1F|nr:uncharacterized protein B0P05DRAFT_530223 [Gilbertella persicaria]KAI8090302.1 hypothetical protein B0P05DRAFT_530223 [Gilbertella persicaria]